MCLTNDPVAVRLFLNKNKNKKEIKVYKTVYVLKDTDGNLRFYGYFQEKFEYKVGMNYSNTLRTELPCLKNVDIKRGLHVYLEKQYNDLVDPIDTSWMNKTARTEYIVNELQLTACLCDLIGIESYNSTTPEEAAFTKLRLSRREYNRVKKLLNQYEKEHAC